MLFMALTYPHPPVGCVQARRRDPRAGTAGSVRGDARSRGCGTAGIPAGDRMRMHRRRRGRRAAWVPRRADRGPGNGCATIRGRAAGVRGARGSCGRRTPKTPILTDQAELKCLIWSS